MSKFQEYINKLGLKVDPKEDDFTFFVFIGTAQILLFVLMIVYIVINL